MFDDSMKRMLSNDIKSGSKKLVAKEQSLPEQAVTVSKIGKESKATSIADDSDSKPVKSKRQKIQR